MKNVAKRFTLLELLVVLAIIGILITLLLPSLKAAQEKTKLAVCMNNLKQIGFGTALWSKENDYWTAAKTWSQDSAKVGSLKPYTGTDRGITQSSFSGLYHCPSLTQDRFALNYKYTSYAINYSTMYPGKTQEAKKIADSRGRYKLAQVVKPARKVYFAEAQLNVLYPDFANGMTSRWHPPFTGVYGKTNILWLDGHVSIEPSDFVTRGGWWDYYFIPLSD